MFRAHSCFHRHLRSLKYTEGPIILEPWAINVCFIAILNYGTKDESVEVILEWPPGSPDLTRVEFYTHGHLKAVKVCSFEHLQE
jgi:hypothetical protein